MRVQQPLQRLPRNFLQNLIFRDPDFPQDTFTQGLFQHHPLLPGVNTHILKSPVHRHRDIRQKRPGCGRPNHESQGFILRPFPQGLRVVHKKFNIDRRRRVVFIFHFRLRQSGFTIRAPVHRFEPAVNVSVFDQTGKGLQDPVLVFRGQGKVRLLPLPQDAKPFKLLPLDIDIFHRIVMRFPPEIDRIHLRLAFLQFLKQLVLNRQAVAIPSGDI